MRSSGPRLEYSTHHEQQTAAFRGTNWVWLLQRGSDRYTTDDQAVLGDQHTTSGRLSRVPGGLSGALLR